MPQSLRNSRAAPWPIAHAQVGRGAADYDRTLVDNIYAGRADYLNGLADSGKYPATQAAQLRSIAATRQRGGRHNRVRNTGTARRERMLVGSAGGLAGCAAALFSASMAYISLYRMHLIGIHGWIKGLILILIGHVNQVVRPKLKLH